MFAVLKLAANIRSKQIILVRPHYHHYGNIEIEILLIKIDDEKKVLLVNEKC